MTETVELFGPGEFIYIRDVAGRLWVYSVRADGTLNLVQGPEG